MNQIRKKRNLKEIFKKFIRNKIIEPFQKDENESTINYHGDMLIYLIPINVLLLVQNKLMLIKELVLGLIFSEIFKIITKIPRPNDKTPNNTSDDKSFFSGHVIGAAVPAFFLYYNNNEKSLYSKFLILSSVYVGYSRIYSDAHRFEDVLTSLLVSKNLANIQ